MSERDTADTPIPVDADSQRAPRAWCPACRRHQPCARHLGTTDWQATPVYACRACGHLIHDLAPAPLDAAPDMTAPAP